MFSIEFVAHMTSKRRQKGTGKLRGLCSIGPVEHGWGVSQAPGTALPFAGSFF